MIITAKLHFDIKSMLEERTNDSVFIEGLCNDIEPNIFMYRPIGIENAVKLLHDAKRVLVYYDPDVDGVASGEMASTLCNILELKYFQYVNNNRKHGFSDNVIDMCLKNSIDTCLCVDFTAEHEMLQKLNNKGIKVVCVDHHVPQNIPRIDDMYTLINNQYKQEDCPEYIKTLSGAGVVYYFVYWTLLILGEKTKSERLQKVAKEWLAKNDYKVLVGISLLADSRDIENEICRYFLYCTYNEWHNTKYSDFILSFKTKEYTFGTPKIERNFIDFDFSPVINSLFRFNKGSSVIRAFNSLSIDDSLLSFKQIQRTLVDYLYKNTIFVELDKIVFGTLNVGELICESVIGTPANIDNFVGLIASRAKEAYSKSSFVLADARKELNRGSVRGHDTSFNYLEVFRKNMIANGHTMAFGTYSSSNVDIHSINRYLVKYDVQGLKYSHYETSNLKTFLSQQDVKKIAYINMFLKSDRQILIEYKGKNITLRMKRGMAKEYDVDGVSVVAFTEKNKMLHPVIVSGYLQLFFE